MEKAHAVIMKIPKDQVIRRVLLQTAGSEVATVVHNLANLPNNWEFSDSHVLGRFRVLYLVQRNRDFQIRESLEQCSYNGKSI